MSRWATAALGTALLLGVATLLPTARAADPVDVYEFESATAEARYRDLIAQLRCPKCLNTSLLGSDAPIAQDLRRTVYRLAITEGRSDAEVRSYLQRRYGDFVLYDPPLRPGTYLLWFGPALALLIGLLVWRRTLRGAASVATTLSAAQRQRLDALVQRDG